MDTVNQQQQPCSYPSPTPTYTTNQFNKLVNTDTEYTDTDTETTTTANLPLSATPSFITQKSLSSANQPGATMDIILDVDSRTPSYFQPTVPMPPMAIPIPIHSNSGFLSDTIPPVSVHQMQMQMQMQIAAQLQHQHQQHQSSMQMNQFFVNNSNNPYQAYSQHQHQQTLLPLQTQYHHNQHSLPLLQTQTHPQSFSTILSMQPLITSPTTSTSTSQSHDGTSTITTAGSNTSSPILSSSELSVPYPSTSVENQGIHEYNHQYSQYVNPSSVDSHSRFFYVEPTCLASNSNDGGVNHDVDIIKTVIAEEILSCDNHGNHDEVSEYDCDSEEEEEDGGVQDIMKHEENENDQNHVKREVLDLDLVDKEVDELFKDSDDGDSSSDDEEYVPAGNGRTSGNKRKVMSSAGFKSDGKRK
ncbi:hypothetical protein HDU76_006482, partial [Blyttiomyces sp. JEL0837]